jgi:hypothetical protein
VRHALLALILATAAASIPGAAAGGGIGLSASPLRLTLRGASTAAITVRNPGRRPLLVDVSRAGFGRSLHGKPQVRSARGVAGWLRLRPRRIRLRGGAKAVLHVRTAPPRSTPPGDHPALVLLTTRPLGVKHVRVRLRVGVIVDLRVRGKVMRRLAAGRLTLRRVGTRRLLELRLVNRGNVTEELGGSGLRLSLFRGRRRFATLEPRRGELLPHSSGVAVFSYGGRVRGPVVARVELGAPVQGPRRAFHLRL